MKYELPSTELIVIEENNYLKFGEYSLLHTFDKCNAKELLDILNEVSE